MRGSRSDVEEGDRSSSAAPPDDVSRTRLAVVALALALLGVAANHASVPIGFTVSYVFGSLFGLVAIALCGARVGVLVAAMIASVTWRMWNHPWAFVIFTLEALWVAGVRARWKTNLILADGTFWGVLGLPLVALFYHYEQRIGWAGTATVGFKQALNGVFNALLASIAVHHLPLRRWLLGRTSRPRTSIGDLLFHVTAASIMVPSLALVGLENQRDVAEREQATLGRLRAESRGMKASLDGWVARHLEAARSIARVGERAGLVGSETVQRELAERRRLYPDFHNVYVADAAARTIGFDPPSNDRGERTIGLDFADRPYFAELRRTREPVVSDVFHGRGGVYLPIFTISAPILEGGALRGFGLGAVDANKLGGHLVGEVSDWTRTATIVDAHGRVVASSDPARRALDRLPSASAERVVELGDTTRLHLPGSPPNGGVMLAWQGAYWDVRAPIAGTPWLLVVETPAAPLQAALFETSARNLGLVAAVTLLALLVATVVSASLSATPRTLAELSSDLPARLSDGRAPSWPESRIEEMHALIVNFRATAEALRGRLAAITEANAQLEERVAERTRELSRQTEQLQAWSAELERRVAEEVELRRRNEQALFQKARLASMGEMLGNIAHQWRQPLNGLSLVLANVRDAAHEGDLDEPALDEALADAHRLIRKMSSTITDFRDFFRPDKEREPFSALALARETIAIVEASFRSADVTITLDAPDDVAIVGLPNEYSQVLLNLLGNARQAISARGGGGRVLIRLVARGGEARLSVLDDGGGVPASIVDRIFEPYFSTREGGTGIGLYMSRQIVERSFGGRIEVRNVDGGAELTVCTPVAPDAARPAG